MDTFSNMRTVEIHKNALVVEPHFVLPETLNRLCEQFESNTFRSANYAELGDYEGKHPYQQALSEIDAAIGQLKRFRREVQQLAGHAHCWDSNDYCGICGMDGRA